MTVKVLPEDVVNKIAAGEMVERPASVVKELIENSIDAESSEITVEVKSEGREWLLIRVIDNGIGMEKDDAALSVQRHATSKINSIDDLFQINSFGFRGEAIPSIAAVSHFELISRAANCLVATKVEIDGGVFKSLQTTGSPVGTRVSVSELFYNTPARLKFLKGEITELNHIINHVDWAAMAHPQIRFKLSHNGKNIIDLPVCQNIIERINLIYGKEFAENLLEFSSDFPSLKLECYAGNPNLTKPNRSYQLFFLNRRPIRSRTLSAALNEAMKPLLPKDRNAVAFLFLKLNPSEVDVNVHPSKLEVRFKNERTLFSQVVQTLNSGLYQQKYIPQIKSESSESSESIEVPESDKSSSPLSKSNLESAPFGFEDRFQMPKAPDPKLELELLDFDNLALKTRLFDTYILVEGEDKLIFIDQHVAHERVLYERFVAQFNRRQMPSQGLLIPITIDLSSAQLATLTLNVNESLLKDVGFDLELFGGRSIIVRSIPAAFQQTKAIHALSDILEQLSSEFDPASIQQKVLTTMACRAAVKAGDKISDEEIVNLLKELSQTKLPFNCPHARPIMITMSKAELETRFKRR